MVQIMLKFSHKIVMKIVSEIKNIFFELLLFEHGYIIYYSRYMREILSRYSKDSKWVKLVLEF